MSAENVAAIRGVYEAMARGDFWAAREVFDPEIVWQWSPRMSGMTGVSEYHGIEGVEAATRDFFEPWDWFRQEAEEFIDLGDQVVVATRTHARMKGSDRELEGTAADLWTFRDGKVIRFRLFDTRAEALEAAGVSE